MKYLFSILLLGFAGVAHAQGVEMADTLRSNGKIYVIVLIIMIVLGGLITYLFLMDRKLDKIEKQLSEKEQTKSASKSF
jgi:uncharacterized membrane protein YqgA involved in biofilm formation